MSISSRHRKLATFAPLLLLSVLGGGVSPVIAVEKKREPIVRILKAPKARTNATIAEFKFKTRASRTWCRRDGQKYRRCRSHVTYTGLRPGRHTFVVRARHRGRNIFVSRKWTVLRRTTTPPAAVPDRAPSIDADTGAAVLADRALLFSEEFDGTSIDETAWDLYDSPGHDGIGLRRPAALSLDGNGNLVVTAKMVNDVIVSGGMAHRLDFTYGRVEFRVRAEPDPTATMSAVVLTWPQKQWSPEFTENDMYETGPQVNNRGRFETFIHYGTDNSQKWVSHRVDPSQWHTIAMEWRPDLLEIYIDGMLSWSLTDPVAIPDVLHHVCIQLDARGKRRLTQPVRMWVDYVRVYQ